MKIKWTDLKIGDRLTFTPEFIRYAWRDSGVRGWFLEDVVPLGIPKSFDIEDIEIFDDHIILYFYWDSEPWTINYNGLLSHAEMQDESPVVFDIVGLAEE